MVQNLASIREAALHLSAEEREELAIILFETLENPELDFDSGSEESLKLELDRRAEEAKSDPGSLMTWEDVRDMR